MFANDHDLNKICTGFFWTTVYKCCNDDLYTWRNVCFPVAQTEEEGRERKGGGGGGKKSCKVPSVCFSVVCLIFAVVSYCQRVTWKHHVITVSVCSLPVILSCSFQRVTWLFLPLQPAYLHRRTLIISTDFPELVVCLTKPLTSTLNINVRPQCGRFDSLNSDNNASLWDLLQCYEMYIRGVNIH